MEWKTNNDKQTNKNNDKQTNKKGTTDDWSVSVVSGQLLICLFVCLHSAKCRQLSTGAKQATMHLCSRIFRGPIPFPLLKLPTTPKQ